MNSANSLPEMFSSYLKQPSVFHLLLFSNLETGRNSCLLMNFDWTVGNGAGD
jgi:hypothetical protein